MEKLRPPKAKPVRRNVSQFEDIRDIVRGQIGGVSFQLCYEDAKYLISVCELAEGLALFYEAGNEDEGAKARAFLRQFKS